ncbi:hypothetical protein B7R76_04960 [Mageeibacillus indolicus]|uniref:Repeat protein n=1 Tax=Mageeibacillus indolicus TaxID=884684 RepID=A0A2J8B2B8_9FIRM|nr:hypothetical protein [Mageeibacillus indolicus]PNH18903.1 hypothetical protein B7R76_04960 [Mageeibacillus indolicus]
MRKWLREIAAGLSVAVVLTSVDVSGLMAVRALDETGSGNGSVSTVVESAVSGSAAGSDVSSTRATADGGQLGNNGGTVVGGKPGKDEQKAGSKTSGFSWVNEAPKYDEKSDLELHESPDPKDKKDLSNGIYLNENLPKKARFIGPDPVDKAAANAQIENPAQPKLYTYQMNMKLVSKEAGKPDTQAEFYQPYEITVGEKNPWLNGGANILYAFPHVEGYMDPVSAKDPAGTKLAGGAGEARTLVFQSGAGKTAEPGKYMYENLIELANSANQAEAGSNRYRYSEDFLYQPNQIKFKVRHVVIDEKGTHKLSEAGINDFQGKADQNGCETVTASVGERYTLKKLDLPELNEKYECLDEGKKVVVGDSEDFQVDMHYKHKIKKVLFDTDCEEKVNSEAHLAGTAFRIPNKHIEKPGYEFLGWMADKDLTPVDSAQANKAYKAADQQKKYNDKIDALAKDSSVLPESYKTKDEAENRIRALQLAPANAVEYLKKCLLNDTTLDYSMPGEDVKFTAIWKAKRKANYRITYWLEKADYTKADTLEKDEKKRLSRMYSFLFAESKHDDVTAVSFDNAYYKNLADNFIKNATIAQFPDEGTGINGRKKVYRYDREKTELLNAGKTKVEVDGSTNINVVIRRKRFILLFGVPGGKTANIKTERREYRMALRYTDEEDPEGNRILDRTATLSPWIKPPVDCYKKDEKGGLPTSLAEGEDRPYQVKVRFGQELDQVWPLPLNTAELVRGNDTDYLVDPVRFLGWLAMAQTNSFPHYRDTPPLRADSSIILTDAFCQANEWGYVDDSKTYNFEQTDDYNGSTYTPPAILAFTGDENSNQTTLIYVLMGVKRLATEPPEDDEGNTKKEFDYTYRDLYYLKTDTASDSYEFDAPEIRGLKPVEKKKSQEKFDEDELAEKFEKIYQPTEDEDPDPQKNPSEYRMKTWYESHGMSLGDVEFEKVGFLDYTYTRNKYDLLLNHKKRNGNYETRQDPVEFEEKIVWALGQDQFKQGISAEQLGYDPRYKLIGYYMDPSCEVPLSENATMPDYRLNIYAKWGDNSIYDYTIDLNPPAGSKVEYEELEQGTVTDAKYNKKDYTEEKNGPTGKLTEGHQKKTFKVKAGAKIFPISEPKCEGYTFLRWEKYGYQHDQDYKYDMTNPHKVADVFAFDIKMEEPAMAKAVWIKNPTVPVRVEHHFYNKQDKEIPYKEENGVPVNDPEDGLQAADTEIYGMQGTKVGEKGRFAINKSFMPDSYGAAFATEQNDQWIRIVDPKTLAKIGAIPDGKYSIDSGAYNTNKFVRSALIKRFEKEADGKFPPNPNVFRFYYQPFKKRFYYKKYICETTEDDEGGGVGKQGKIGQESDFMIMDPMKVKNNVRDFDTTNFDVIPGFMLKRKDKAQQTVRFGLDDKGDIKTINGQEIPKDGIADIKGKPGSGKLGVEFRYVDVRVLLRNSEAAKTPDGYHRVVIELPKDNLEFTGDFVGSRNPKKDDANPGAGAAGVKVERNKYVVDVVDGFADENIPIPDIVPIKKLAVKKIWLDQRGHNIYSDALYNDGLATDQEEDLEKELDEALPAQAEMQSQLKPLMQPAATKIKLVPNGKYKDANGKEIQPNMVEISDADLQTPAEETEHPERLGWYLAKKTEDDDRRIGLPLGTPMVVNWLKIEKNKDDENKRKLVFADFLAKDTQAEVEEGNKPHDPNVYQDPASIALGKFPWQQAVDVNKKVRKLIYKYNDDVKLGSENWLTNIFEKFKGIDGRPHDCFQYTATEDAAREETDGYESGVFMYHKVKVRAAGQAAGQAGGEAAGQAGGQAAGQAGGQAAGQATGQATGQAVWIEKNKLFEIELGGIKEGTDKDNWVKPQSVVGKGIALENLKELVVLNSEVPTIDVEVHKFWYGKYGQPLDFNTLSVGSAANPKPLTMEMRFLDPVIAKHLSTRSTALTAGDKWHGWIEAVRLKFRRTSPRTYDYNLHEIGEEGGTLSYGGKKFDAIYIGRCLDGFKVINREQSYGFPPVVAICDCARMGMNKAYTVANRAYTAVSEAAGKAGSYIKRQVGKFFGGNGRQTETNGQGGCSSCHLD